MKHTKVICAFPACGKTYCFNNKKSNVTILDSDSSNFNWMLRKRTEEELERIRVEWDTNIHLLDGHSYIEQIRDELIKVRNPDFPRNYIEHIKENIGKVDYIFVSTHKEVREALKEANIDFALVFPNRTLKAEWVGRCYLRNSGTAFCDVIAKEWDNWMLEMDTECKENNRKHVRLKHGEYLNDVLEYINLLYHV